MNLPIIVGLGSHHGDDQFGWLVVERLRDLGYPTSRLTCMKHPAELLDVVESDAQMIICDACAGNGRLGSIRRLHWPTDELLNQRQSGSHDMPLREVMQLGGALSVFPKEVLIWAVEGHRYNANEVPCPEVCSAAHEVADKIWQEHGHA